MTDVVPDYPIPLSYEALDRRTWVQLRECTFLAETALALLAPGNEMAREVLAAMERILTAEPYSTDEMPRAADLLRVLLLADDG